MLIENWMTKNVFTLTPERTMMKASKLMKEKNINRIPVVDEQGRLVGIISDRDIKEASPSKATTLDMHELYYLLAEIKLKDIMTKGVYTVKRTDTVEKAAVIMHSKNVGGLPVVDDDNRVVGIITDSDVFNVLINITGVLHGGLQIGLELSMERGELDNVLDLLRQHDARIMSLLTSYGPPEQDKRQVFIRVHDMSKESVNHLKSALEKEHEILIWTRDPVSSLTS
ncbi:MAG: acetoin utilization protein AcuB [Desulfovibrionales bacterium]|jgi:acetoin utilization protein AcuB|nr:acetoin utilization protein AcuB [Desulfovibrionales bacterium]